MTEIVNTVESLEAASGSMQEFGEAADLVDRIKLQETNGGALALVLAYRQKVREDHTIITKLILHCPNCSKQHIDTPKPCTAADCESVCCQPEDCNAWTNPPHKSHLCDGCGFVWRPSDAYTEGVKSILTKGKSDSLVVYPDNDLEDFYSVKEF